LSRIFLIPTTLGETPIDRVIPAEVQTKVKTIRHFIVEDVKTARRYLRKMDREFPIDDTEFHILNKHTTEPEISVYMSQIPSNCDIGVMSEAGCPGVADPGAVIVKIAHEKGLEVIPFVGPSSILLGLMGSGFSGQNFSFHGYLPKERNFRVKKIMQLEKSTEKDGSTQIFMDTPFRNMNLLEDLLDKLKPDTLLCLASNITCNDALIKTKTVARWKKKVPDLQKVPCMFLIGR
jgi:16S rRNA (cytidine1402-2'-O)-methyltransferase